MHTKRKNELPLSGLLNKKNHLCRRLGHVIFRLKIIKELTQGLTHITD